MTLDGSLKPPFHVRHWASLLGVDPETWRGQCHVASLQLVKSGLLARSRVARGWVKGIGSQHSWVVVGDPYRPERIVDLTRWSYLPEHAQEESSAEVPFNERHAYAPHGGTGTIWSYGQPIGAVQMREEPIELTPREPLSREALSFLGLMPELGRSGWSVLAHSPVAGWPASEIFEAMYRTEKLKNLIPIDIIGMITDINPSGLYLPGEEID